MLARVPRMAPGARSQLLRSSPEIQANQGESLPGHNVVGVPHPREHRKAPPWVTGFREVKLLHDLAALSGGQLVSKAIGFLTLTYLARVLDPQTYGSVEFAVGLVIIFGTVVECGLTPVGIRRLARQPKDLVALAAQIPAARLLIALVIVPLVWFSSGLIGLTDETETLVRLFLLGLLAVPFTQNWLIQGLEMMRLAAIAPVIRMGAFGLGVILFVRDSADILTVGLIEIASVTIFACYFLVIQQARVTPVRVSISVAEFKNLSSEGYLLGLSNMIWALIQYVPLFLVTTLIGGDEAGWFGAPHRFTISLLALSGLYFFNLYPSIARRIGEPLDDLQALVHASHRVVSWMGILSSLVLMLLAKPLLVIAFGNRFAVAAPAFSILIWILPVTLLSGHARWVLTAVGLQGEVLAVHLAGLVTVVAFGFVFVDALQAEGAAIAAVVASLTMWGVAHYYVCSKVTSIPGVRYALRPTALALASLLLSYCTGMSPWWNAAIAVSLFVACAPFIDSELLADFRTVAHAKSWQGPGT
jgi:O-antigen/teichoic acid export membrane protein